MRQAQIGYRGVDPVPATARRRPQPMPEPTTRRGKDTKGRIVELAAALM